MGAHVSLEEKVESLQWKLKAYTLSAMFLSFVIVFLFVKIEAMISSPHEQMVNLQAQMNSVLRVFEHMERQSATTAHLLTTHAHPSPEHYVFLKKLADTLSGQITSLNESVQDIQTTVAAMGTNMRVRQYVERMEQGVERSDVTSTRIYTPATSQGTIIDYLENLGSVASQH